MLIAASITLCIALLLLAGAVVARFLHARTPGAERSLGQRGASMLTVGSLLLFVGALARLLVTVQLLRDDEPWGSLLLTVARDTSAGRWTAAMAGLAVVIAVAGRRWPGRAAALGLAGGAAGLALSGHASEVEPTAVWVTLDTVHAGGALLWIGGLIALVPALRQAESGALLARFSPIALTGATIAVGSGIARAWTVVPSLDALQQTAYGRLLLVKSALVLVVLFLGWRNYRSHAKRLTLDSVRSRALQRRAGLEVAVASIVIIVTGFLSTTSPSD